MPIQADIHSITIMRRKAAAALATYGVTLCTAATFVGCSISTVSRSIKRINEIGNVSDYERSGRPALYSEALRLELIGFYCQTQPLPNSGRWTIRWAATHLEQHPEIINARPSKSTIQRILKENNLKPHQSRYFLHITDPDFFPKMNHLIDLYLNPPQNLFFFDECPGIQILKRLTPDIRTDETAKTLEEFEYIRNGTMNVLAFFNYADGKVYADCKADHKTDTFLEMFKKHVFHSLSGGSETETEKLHYVMDNLSTHRGYPFCEAVAELSGITCPPQTELDSLAKRVKWLSSPDKKIVIHFTPYHGSWLNLVEFWFGIMNKKVLNGSYGSAEELKEGFDAFLEEWNVLLAHPFRWSYDGKGLQQKAVKRFTVMLEQSAHKLEVTTLTKQLRLMTNLFCHYFNEVSEEHWGSLFCALQHSKEILESNIENEDGPKKKKNARISLDALLFVLEEYIYQDMAEAV
jgi:transposase